MAGLGSHWAGEGAAHYFFNAAFLRNETLTFHLGRTSVCRRLEFRIYAVPSKGAGVTRRTSLPATVRRTLRCAPSNLVSFASEGAQRSYSCRLNIRPTVSEYVCRLGIEHQIPGAVRPPRLVVPKLHEGRGQECTNTRCDLADQRLSRSAEFMPLERANFQRSHLPTFHGTRPSGCRNEIFAAASLFSPRNQMFLPLRSAPVPGRRNIGYPLSSRIPTPQQERGIHAA